MSAQQWLDSLTPINNVSYPSPQQGGMQTLIDGPVYSARNVARLLSKIEADHVAAVAALIDDQVKQLEEYDQRIVAAVAEAEQRGYDRALGDEPVESDPLYLRGRNDGYDAAMNEVPAIAVYGERLRSEGHAAGLDAARDAVADEQDVDCTCDGCDRIRDALAAIDALRGAE